MQIPDGWYFSTPEGGRSGPISYRELCERIRAGQVRGSDFAWAGHMDDWKPISLVPELIPWLQGERSIPAPPLLAGQEAIDSIRTLEMVSAIVWSVIAGVQILVAISGAGAGSIFLFAAGVWNVFGAISRFQMIKSIEKRLVKVVRSYEGIASLVIVCLANLIIGGVIGALWVIIDFVIRDRVLKNRHLFVN